MYLPVFEGFVCRERGISGLQESNWAGLVLVPTLARNFPQVVGRYLLFFKKIKKKNGFVCLIPVFYSAGGAGFHLKLI